MPVFGHVPPVTDPRTRRAVLHGTALALPALAGCSLPTRSDDPTTPEQYPHLERATLFVASRLDITLPSAVSVVDQPADADVALFPTDPSVTPEEAVEWLAGGTAVGVVGSPAHEFLLEVQRSEAAADRFGQRGYGVPSPPPHLQFGHAVTDGAGGEIISTSSFSWGGLEDGAVPGDDRVFGALETFLAEEASETASD